MKGCQAAEARYDKKTLSRKSTPFEPLFARGSLPPAMQPFSAPKRGYFETLRANAKTDPRGLEQVSFAGNTLEPITATSVVAEKGLTIKRAFRSEGQSTTAP